MINIGSSVAERTLRPYLFLNFFIHEAGRNLFAIKVDCTLATKIQQENFSLEHSYTYCN